MWYVKPCKCGSIEFEKEIDDEVIRCTHCGRLATLGYENEEEKDEDEGD